MSDMAAAILGHLDGFDGHFLVGWAMYADKDASCLVQVTTADGREVGRGRASRPREDLRAVGRGRSDIAFRIPIEFPSDTDRLHVTVDGVDLPGSPKPIGLGVFDGGFVVESGRLQGVLTERAVGTPLPELRFLDQYDRIVAEGLPIRPQITETGKPELLKIDLDLPPECFGFEELEIRGFADKYEFARTITSTRLKGYLDELSTTYCRGWLFSPDAPLTSFRITAFCGGKEIGSGYCEIAREDLKEVSPLSWRTAGFEFELKLPRSKNINDVSLRLSGSDLELFKGPLLLGDKAGFIASARRAAFTIRANPELSDYDRHLTLDLIKEGIVQQRSEKRFIRTSFLSSARKLSKRRFNIIIPIYKGVSVTRDCVQSVINTRNPIADRVILVEDCSPELGMSSMLSEFFGLDGVSILSNLHNLGFVGSVNRGLEFSRQGNVILLNSDTRVFPGIWDELERILELSPDIGTVTALSNNATIFSYPHYTNVHEKLSDLSWEEVAQEALKNNSGLAIDVPTGHGFCMAIRRDVLDRLQTLDVRFGRGYGEENDLCSKAADLGWRNVAACGVFVEHRESVSFGDEKAQLLSTNMKVLNELYPEYTPMIMEFEREDPLRQARWPIDIRRLKKAKVSGHKYALIVNNWLGGGTNKAIQDIENSEGYQGRTKITLTARSDGGHELTVTEPSILALFSEKDGDELFSMLEAADPDLILVHQLLGSSVQFIERLGRWGEKRNLQLFVHDFYALCPRVTMLDAADQFCGAAETTVCQRCLRMGGVHEAAKFDLPPQDHRALFRDFLKRCSKIIAPSRDAARWIDMVFNITTSVKPHPQHGISFAHNVRSGDYNQVAIIGAIGPHKGSGRLLQLARDAQLYYPEMKFHVIGYTNLDRDLRRIGNVKITGPYNPSDIAHLVNSARAQIALFLHEWPETFSYTLSEAWALGLWPIVPKLGAPAERVIDGLNGTILNVNDSRCVLDAIRKVQLSLRECQEPWLFNHVNRSGDRLSVDLENDLIADLSP